MNSKSYTKIILLEFNKRQICYSGRMGLLYASLSTSCSGIKQEKHKCTYKNRTKFGLYVWAKFLLGIWNELGFYTFLSTFTSPNDIYKCQKLSVFAHILLVKQFWKKILFPQAAGRVKSMPKSWHKKIPRGMGSKLIV